MRGKLQLGQVERYWSLLIQALPPLFSLQGIYLSNKKLLHIRSSSQIHFIHLEFSHSQMSHPKMLNLGPPPSRSMKLTGHTPGQRQGVCQLWMRARPKGC